MIVHDLGSRLEAAEGKVSAARQMALDGRPDSFMESVRRSLRDAGVEPANLATSLVMRDLREHLGRALHATLEPPANCPRCGHTIANHWPNSQDRPTTACVVCLDGRMITGPDSARGVCCIPAHRIIHEVT